MDVKRFGIDVIIIESGAIATEWASIAMDYLLEVSSRPYMDKAKIISESFKKSNENASDPTVIARVIKRAIEAKKPKTRYVAGKHARMTLLLHSILSDRQFDKFFIKMLGIS